MAGFEAALLIGGWVYWIIFIEWKTQRINVALIASLIPPIVGILSYVYGDGFKSTFFVSLALLVLTIILIIIYRNNRRREANK